MIKMVALVNKKRDLNNKDFVRYWLDIHAPLEKKGMAELWFNDEDALKVALASEERAISREDFLKFVDNAKIMITKEYVIHDEINK
jgi:hypothetical protein